MMPASHGRPSHWHPVGWLAGASVLFGLSPARADDLGVLLGHTWTRDEVRGRELREGHMVDRLGTGHCFTITLPYAHPVRGPWAWSTAVTVFHPDYDGRAVSTAEIPLALRWTGGRAGLRAFVETGPALSWGAGMSPGREHEVAWSATLDAGAGLSAPIGDDRVVLAIHALNRPQDGQWGRRIALQAGVTRRTDLAPEGTQPRPAVVRRPGSLFGGASARGRHARHWEIVPVAGFNARGGATIDLSDRDGPRRVDRISATTGTQAGVVASFCGTFAVRLSALYVEEHAEHRYTEDAAVVSVQRASWAGVIFPLQLQVAAPRGAVRPFLALGPVLAGTTIDEMHAIAPWPPRGIPHCLGGFLLPLGLLLHPTAGADVSIGSVSARAEVRAFTSQSDYSACDHVEHTTAMYLLGVRLLP